MVVNRQNNGTEQSVYNIKYKNLLSGGDHSLDQ